MTNLALPIPTAPQLIEDMSNADYHAHPAFSSSQIKDMLRSPAHFFANHLDPQRGEKSPTEEKVLGTVVHTLTLEPHNAERDIAVKKKVDGRSKEGKEYNAQFAQLSQGKAIIDEDKYANAVVMADNLKRHPFLADIIANNYCMIEASIFYYDEATGLNLRVRPDLHIPPCTKYPNGLIVDVKTTSKDARARGFSGECGNYRYDLSASMYRIGMQAYYGTDGLPDFYFAVVESTAPFNSVVYKASDDMLMIGESAYRDALSQLAECLAINEWDGYSTDVTDIYLPKYIA